MHGATGIILYSDPADYAMGQTDSSQVYPHDWWLPASGAQRGTIFLGSGDPLTPGYPATGTDLFCSQNLKCVSSLPKLCSIFHIKTLS